MKFQKQSWCERELCLKRAFRFFGPLSEKVSRLGHKSKKRKKKLSSQIESSQQQQQQQQTDFRLLHHLSNLLLLTP